jgi:hypothetical protein
MYATALCGIRAGSFPLIPFDLFLIHVLIIVRTYRLPTLRAVKQLLARPDRFDLLRGWIPLRLITNTTFGPRTAI